MSTNKEKKPKGPETFSGLKDVITDRYPELRGQLKRIAEFALDNPNDLALKTVSAVAEEIGVQPSSMVRFAKHFGYDGFSDLQQVFRSRLVAQSPSYTERIQRIRHTVDSRGQSDTASQVLSDFVDQGMAALDMLRANTPVQSIERAVEIMADADDIYLLAQRRAFPVSFYMSYALSRLEQRCILVDGIGGLMGQQISLARKQDVVIAVSFRPYTASVVEQVVELAQRDVPIIAITDSALSPIALHADVAFEIQEPDAGGFRTLSAPMCLAQSIVVSLGHHLAANRSKRKRK